jgi:hypothetical protein
MALRDFTDANGYRWRVWNVAPHIPDITEGEDVTTPGWMGSAEAITLQKRLVPGLEGGWLCFDNDAEKRRLNPIPERWEEMDEPALRGLLDRAVPVRKRSG